MRHRTPLRSYRTRFYESTPEDAPPPPYYGAGWEVRLEPHAGLGAELVLRARYLETAQYAANVFVSVADALGLLTLHQEVTVSPEELHEAGKPAALTRDGIAYIALKGAARVFRLAGFASRRSALVTAFDHLRLSRRLCPAAEDQQAPPAIRAHAVIAAYSILEVLKVDIASAEKWDSPIKHNDGSWNPGARYALESRLRQAKVDYDGTVEWITRRGHSLSLPDAIYAAHLIRNRSDGERGVAPNIQGVRNVQRLARALILEALHRATPAREADFVTHDM